MPKGFRSKQKGNGVFRRFYKSQPKPAFKRGTALEKDLVVLSTACLVGGQAQLKGLMDAIVTLHTKHKKNKEATELIAKCAEFTVYLARYVEQCPSQQDAAGPVELFAETIKYIHGFDSSNKAWLETIKVHVDETIKDIESSHPSLGDLKKEPRSHGLPGTVVSILDIGVPVLDLLAEVLDTIGTVPFLHPVLSAVTGLFHAAQQTQSNFDNMLSLSNTAGKFVLSIAEQCSTFQELPANLADAIKKLESRLCTIASRCQKMSQKSFISCIVQNNAFKDELDELERDLNNAIQEFQNANLVNIQVDLGRIASNVEWVKLDGLPKHPDMSGKLAEYLAESRQPNVDDVCKWIESSKELLLCIHGTAGVGKSTLARHLSDTLRAAGRLAGSIFLGAPDFPSGGPETIIQMLAREIGRIHPRTIPVIVEAMKQSHATPLETQLQRYIIEPLQSLKYPFPLVVIVDAIDEWKDRHTFTKSLPCLNSYSSVVKFITTSRLNLCASRQHSIDSVSASQYCLLPVSTDVIKAYFSQYLQTGPLEDGGWKASPADINELAELSGGLPVWAATVKSLLLHKFRKSHPQELVLAILTSRHPVGARGELGELYRNALTRLFPSLDEQEYFRQYFGTTSVLQEPVSLTEFPSFTRNIPPYLFPIIQSALSVLQTRFPQQAQGFEETIHPATMLFHVSLLEYVQATTTESTFRISTMDCHSTLGLTCLQRLYRLLMSKSPLDISSLSSLDHYAVKYWPVHVFHGTSRFTDQWQETELCSMLKKMEAGVQRWLALFLEALVTGKGKQGMDSFLGAEGSLISILRELARWLGQDGEDRWEIQVACLEVAVRIDGSNAEVWSALGYCYQARGDSTAWTDSLKMHEEAVIAFRGALRLRPDPSFDRAASLDDLASALRSCYKRKRDAGILAEAIVHHGEALTLLPASHPDRARFLSNCASALQALYERNGDIEVLEEVISLNNEVLALRPAPHPDRPSSLHNLATSRLALYQHSNKIDMLGEVFSRIEEALLSAPHPDRSGMLNTLSTAYRAYFILNKDVDTLNKAISLGHEALALCPPSHPDYSLLLTNLAAGLHWQYLHGQKKDAKILDECISLNRQALALQSAAHPDRSLPRNNLAEALLSRFEKSQAVMDLDEAISLRRELLDLHPPGNRYRAFYIDSLVALLETRFGVTGDVQGRETVRNLKAEYATLTATAEATRNSVQDRGNIEDWMAEYYAKYIDDEQVMGNVRMLDYVNVALASIQSH